MKYAPALPQVVLIGSSVLASWLGMQLVHECGHALAAVFTGGQVKQVVLHPLTISRTDLALNPQPLAVVWAGPVFGVLLPVVLWAIAAGMRMPRTFVLRFFAGFCLVANGAYIAFGSFARIGDCGEMLRHGSQLWQLWAFGIITIPAGFWLWNGQGAAFGLGTSNGAVDARTAYVTLLAAVLLIVLGLSLGGR